MSLPYAGWNVVFGATPTAAFWSELGANDDALAAGTGFNTNVLDNKILHDSYKFSIFRTAALTATAGVSTVFPFDTKTFDTGSNADVTTNKGRVTIPYNGFYFFMANVEFSTTANSIALLLFLKNGGQVGRGNDARYNSANKGITGTAFLQLVAGDYIEVAIFSDTAATIDTSGITNNTFSGFLFCRD